VCTGDTHCRHLVRLFVSAEGRCHNTQGSSMDMLLSPQKQLQKQLPPDIAMAGAQWGCYSSPAALDGLLDWLNPKGEQLLLRCCLAACQCPIVCWPCRVAVTALAAAMNISARSC
jgi:hypothetical protein